MISLLFSLVMFATTPSTAAAAAGPVKPPPPPPPPTCRCWTYRSRPGNHRKEFLTPPESGSQPCKSNKKRWFAVPTTKVFREHRE